MSASEDRLTSDAVGEVELERKVLVVKRITVTYHPHASSDKRSVVERVRTGTQVACVPPVERVNVPGCALQERDVSAKSVPHFHLLVPRPDDARIGHPVAVPYAEPHHVDPQVRRCVVREDLVGTHRTPARHSGQAGKTRRAICSLPTSCSSDRTLYRVSDPAAGAMLTPLGLHTTMV